MLSLTLALLLQAQSVASVSVYTAERDTSFRSPDLPLTRVDLRAMPDGQFYLADTPSSTLFRVSADGRRTQAVITPGEGPGHANQLFIFGWVGDSLGIFDWALLRFTLVPANQGKTRSALFREACRDQQPLTIMRDGACLIRMKPANPGQRSEPIQTIALAQPKRGKVDTIVRASVAHTTRLLQIDQGQITILQPFVDDPLVLIAPTGDFLALVTRVVARTKRTATYSVQFWSPTTGWSGSHAFEYAPVPLAKETQDSAIHTVINRIARINPLTRLRATDVRNGMFLPEYWPPVEQARITRDSMLWIATRDRLANSKDERSFRVIAPSGTHARTVLLPTDVDLLDAYGTTVWGTIKDKNDVPELVRYRLSPVR